MERHIVTTADGSHSLFIPELNEHYHSVYGAIQESSHIFIQNGLAAASKNQQPLNILEIGMGTGLNLFLSFLHIHSPTPVNATPAAINYTALEPYPVTPFQAAQLNYVSLLNATTFQAEFNLIHASSWNTPVFLSERFRFLKLNLKIEEATFANNSFALIYFDAFAPNVQPELWTQVIFEKLYQALAPGGFLITYCAKGNVKRALKHAGFSLVSLPGPIGKREITKAIKP